MKKQKNIIKSILLIVITMFLTTINVFATVGTDNSNMILSMPIKNNNCDYCRNNNCYIII